MAQNIISGKGSCAEIGRIIESIGVKKALLVCDSSFRYLSIKDAIEQLPCDLIKFDGFTSNPLYEDVCKGVEMFKNSQCEAIIAVGGGSAIDVAKCIKLFSGMSDDKNYLEQEYKDTKIPLIAIPTTAGTGSESTRHAVIYFGGQKQSISHKSIIPDYAILDSSVLKTLPLYQKKCTMLDALCQGIESWWSVNSTDESIEYSKQAENITQTTAPHAMSYKLTSMYHLPHGHAVAVCLPEVWAYILGHIDRCADNRGAEYLKQTLDEIAEHITKEQFREIMRKLEIENPIARDRAHDLDILAGSVNEARLKNNPIMIPKDGLKEIYDRII